MAKIKLTKSTLNLYEGLTIEQARALAQSWMAGIHHVHHCMVLIKHKIVATFMHYIHTEDAPLRQAADLMANQRTTAVGAQYNKKAAV